MKYTEIKDKSVAELNQLLKEKKLSLFMSKQRFRLGQLQKTSDIRDIRKDIAKIETALSEKRRG
jgi:large subunit ribosomal protein L29